nr:RNA-directed DNA polymerase, eukaryota, reverse transcriptase zinc-binding domain protein [Tanacetum cinerariifolium]
MSPRWLLTAYTDVDRRYVNLSRSSAEAEYREVANMMAQTPGCVTFYGEVMENRGGKIQESFSELESKNYVIWGASNIGKISYGKLAIALFSMFHMPLSVLKSLQKLEKNSFGVGWGRVKYFIGSNGTRFLLHLGEVWFDKKIGEDIDEIGLEFMSSCVGEEKILQVENAGHDTCWNKLVLKKVNVFVWRAIKGRLPVCVKLERRGIDSDSVLCACCNDSVETCTHCLVTCDLAMSVWNKLFNWWKVGNVNIFTIEELFSHSGNLDVHTSLSSIWQAVTWTSGYFIWKERNARVLEI